MLPQVVIQQSGATVTGTWSAANTNWNGTLEGTLTSGGLTGTMTFNGLRGSLSLEAGVAVTGWKPAS